MALVDYASLSEDDEDAVSDHALSVSTTAQEPSNKLKRKSEAQHDLPPLPSMFHNLYASNVRTTIYDDPAFHRGRKRIQPHVKGNWPTHLYIEWWPKARELEALSELIESFSSIKDVKFESLLESELGAPLPLHISLSRSLTLNLQNKAAFLLRVQSALSSSSVPSFEVKPQKCAWVSNYEKTRWFLVLSLDRPSGDELNNLLGTCNAIAADFNLPTLYDSPYFEAATSAHEPSDMNQDDGPPSNEFDRSSAFHISIAWALMPPSQELIEVAQAWSNAEEQIPNFEVKDIKAKIGNAVTSIPLKLGNHTSGGKKSLFSVLDC